MNFTEEIENGMGSVTQRFPKYSSTDPAAATGAVEHHMLMLPKVYDRGFRPADPGVIGAQFPKSVWQQAHDDGLFFTQKYPEGWGVTNSVETKILTPEGAALWDQYVNYGWQYPLR